MTSKEIRELPDNKELMQRRAELASKQKPRIVFSNKN